MPQTIPEVNVLGDIVCYQVSTSIDHPPLKAVYICRTGRLDLHSRGIMKNWHLSHKYHEPLCIKKEHFELLGLNFANQGWQHCSPWDGCSRDHKYLTVSSCQSLS